VRCHRPRRRRLARPTGWGKLRSLAELARRCRGLYITHSGGFVSACAASIAVLDAVGIDSEVIVDGATLADIQPLVTSAGELASLARSCAFGSPALLTLVFSAKESVYKCLHPLVKTFFDFHDAEIVAIDVAARMFHFRLLRDLGRGFVRGYHGKGRFEVCGGLVHTALELPRAH